MNTHYLMANASAGCATGENSARKQTLAVVPFRARTHVGAAQIDLILTPDSAPWIHPVH
jgi:hypothetical protein